MRYSISFCSFWIILSKGCKNLDSGLRVASMSGENVGISVGTTVITFTITLPCFCESCWSSVPGARCPVLGDYF
ncbi:hypothetical protein BJX70DRAFT_63245 [Aspergillus crustosus]